MHSDYDVLYQVSHLGSLLAIALGPIFLSTFTAEIGLQFEICLLSFTQFSIRGIIAVAFANFKTSDGHTQFRLSTVSLTKIPKMF